jgi:hypothetical protein
LVASLIRQAEDSVPLSGGLRIWRGFTHCDQRVMLNVMRFGVVWQALQRRVSSR